MTKERGQAAFEAANYPYGFDSLGPDSKRYWAFIETAVRNAALEEAAKMALQLGGHGFSYVDYPAKQTAKHQADLIASALICVIEKTQEST